MPVTRDEVLRAIHNMSTPEMRADARAGNDILATIALLLLEIRDQLKFDMPEEGIPVPALRDPLAGLAEAIDTHNADRKGKTAAIESGVVARRAAEGKSDT